ncbi:efflux RND transporter permease subunit, partial [Allisonella histaminiformans]|uniref:efflux RND transporter permease subunit n=1 Tax=Allisonella histaminiformans TaxID=209880 RepID=UPI00307CC325
MSKFFIERPIFAIVMAIVISIAGVLCMFTLPVDRYPHITPPQVSVQATYYGADSQVVNDTVAEVIEKQVVSVEGFDNMSSTSNSNGSYSLNVQFKSGVDDDMATVRVQNAVSQATAGLPDSVKTLGVTTQKSSGDMALVISLQSPNNTYDAAFLKNYFSINYLDELKTIPGVGNITEWGSDYAMRVWLDPMKMTKNNITTSEIVNAIATQNQQIAGGIIGTAPVAQGTALQYIVNAEGRLKTPEQFGEIVLRTNADGSLLKLKDVSRIVLDQRSYDFIARSGNHASSALGISLTSDANAVQTLTQIKEKLAQDAKSFPEDMTYAINMDNTDFINASINEVMHTFFEALVLVAIIVYIFLQNWRSTLIPMIAVPVSLLGTIASFEVLGFTINTLTLFAMVLAIGLVVDDAIVVIEAVEYEMRYNGKSPKEATYIAMQKVQSPVIGVACVLAAVFVPVSFLGGIMGILYKQFALTIAISVILSAFVALSLTPTLCASILKEESKVIERGRLQKFWDKFNDGFDRMVKIYGNFLRRLAKRLVVPMGVLVALTVISGVLFVKLPTAFLPSEDNGYFFASFTLPEGSVNVRTNQEVEKFLSFIAKQPGVQEEMGITGFDILSGGQKSNAATSFVKLKPWDERKTPDTSVDAMVGKAFAFGAMNPGANIIAMNPPPIPGLGT